MAKKIYLQENLLLDIPPAVIQFNSGVSGTGTVDLAKWITDAAADGTITIVGGPSAGVASVNTRTGAVTLTKADVALSNVDNTTDIAKPVSTAQATAIGLKTDKSTLTTKGDLYAATAANTPARVAVGTDGQILTADAVSAAGVKWSTTTNTFTGTSAVLTSTVNGIVATVTPASGSIQDTLGFNSTGTLVKQVVSGGGTAISQYSAGSNVLVTSYGTGITAAKSSGIWTITVPSGVVPIEVTIDVASTDVNVSGDASGATNWINAIFTGAGIVSGVTVGSYKFPVLQTFLVPSVGSPAPGNAIAMSSTAIAIIGAAANTFTVRKANMVVTGEHTILTFTGF